MTRLHLETFPAVARAHRRGHRTTRSAIASNVRRLPTGIYVLYGAHQQYCTPTERLDRQTGHYQEVHQ